MAPIPVPAVSQAFLDREALLYFNLFLDDRGVAHRLNEALLEKIWNDLGQLVPSVNSARLHQAWWLTLARINELALFCAGNYADQREYAAAGDLLVNPRLILVHVKNGIRPVVKQRHGKLTDQFAHAAGSRAGVADWLKNNTCLEQRQPPLLPCLLNALKASENRDDDYIRSVEVRISRIAGAIAFLAASRYPENVDLHRHLAARPPGERALVEENLCRFDLKVFQALGRKIYDLFTG